MDPEHIAFSRAISSSSAETRREVGTMYLMCWAIEQASLSLGQLLPPCVSVQGNWLPAKNRTNAEAHCSLSLRA